MEVVGIFRHNLERIAGRVDGDENRRGRDPAGFQNFHGGRVARIVQRADIGAERVAKIDDAGCSDNIRFRNSRSTFIYQGKRPANIASGYLPAATGRKGIGWLPELSHDIGAADQGRNDRGPAYCQCLVHAALVTCSIGRIDRATKTGIQWPRLIQDQRMAVSEFQVFQDQQRSNWVRLHTLVVLRWFAICGQIIAVFCAVLIYDLQFRVGLVSITIGASVLANLFSTFLFPKNKQLSEREAAATLGFDILQLGLLLYLTGGLNNPFALLMLAPVTIAATVLHLRSTVVTGVLAIVIITALSQFYLPLYTETGAVLMLPSLFLFGVWLALVIGVVFLAIYARQVTTEMHTMGEALVATRLALAREQKLTDLGGVVAAAAHELGTPLATIKLVSTELMDELRGQPALYEDAALIGAQADRCRDILRSMGQAGKDDLHLRRAPIEAVLRDAAEPHMNRGKIVTFSVVAEPGESNRQPVVMRRPEIIHGLRNLIQNAVDFAVGSVNIEVRWSATAILVRIEDDGPGFPPTVMERIGMPFMHGRRQIVGRPGYEGMGLGLFIAKTLLERTGATLRFANATRLAGGGAVIAVEWPRRLIDPEQGAMSEPLGENPPLLA